MVIVSAVWALGKTFGRKILPYSKLLVLLQSLFGH